MPWVIGAVWLASANAVELSESTFSASAALIGAATCARSSLVTGYLFGEGLGDRGGLRGERTRGRPIRRHVQRQRRVDRRGDVGVDERHRRPLGQRLARQRVQLLTRDGAVLSRG